MSVLRVVAPKCAFWRLVLVSFLDVGCWNLDVLSPISPLWPTVDEAGGISYTTATDLEPLRNMKTCSKCGQPNEDAAQVCAGCGEKLAAPRPSKVDPALVDPALDPAIVGRFGSLEEASVLQSRLEAAGIEAWIPEEYGSRVFSAVIPLEPLTVQVAAKDLAAARALLAEPAPPVEDSGSPQSKSTPDKT
jgi:hypothetical protein